MNVAALLSVLHWIALMGKFGMMTGLPNPLSNDFRARIIRFLKIMVTNVIEHALRSRERNACSMTFSVAFRFLRLRRMWLCLFGAVAAVTNLLLGRSN